MDYQWPVVRVIGPQMLAGAMKTLLMEHGVPISDDDATVLLIMPPSGGANDTHSRLPSGKAVRMVNHLDKIEQGLGIPPGISVRALVSVDDPLTCVLEAIRALAHNKAYCSPRLLPHLLDFLQQTTTGDLPPSKKSFKETLSQREQEIARAAAQGLSNEEIAQSLHISVATVKFHLGHIFQKLDLSRRSQIGAALNE